MLGVPLFFYEIYSGSFIMKLQDLHQYVSGISDILPDHYIVKQFNNLYFEMTERLDAFVDDDTMEEYFEKVLEFYNFLQLFQRLEAEIRLLQQNRRVRARVRSYYYHSYFKKKNVIFSFQFRKTIDLTLNSLMLKEMEQELYNIERLNYPSRKFQNELPVLLENEEVFA